MVITGKGPLKAKYMTDVKRLEKGWSYVRCSSLWLEVEDYPLLLGEESVAFDRVSTWDHDSRQDPLIWGYACIRVRLRWIYP